MRRVIHCTFALVLFATATCALAHTEMQLNSPAMENCPYHPPSNQQDNQQQDQPSQPNPEHCQDCLTSHFVGESKTVPHTQLMPQLVPEAPDPAWQTLPGSESEIQVGSDQLIIFSHRILRI